MSIKTIYLSILECFEHVEVTDRFLLIIMDDLSMIPSIFLETIYQSTIIVDNIFLCLLCLVDYVHVRLKCGTAKDKISDDQQQKERQTNTAIKPPRISLYSSSTFLKFIFNEANLLQFSIRFFKFHCFLNTQFLGNIDLVLQHDLNLGNLILNFINLVLSFNVLGKDII